MDYRAHGGKGNSQDVADFIEREFLSEEPEPASLEIAKEFINDFCVAEYGSPADFSDLEKVGIAYTTVTDEEIPIQVNADLVHYRMERYLNGQFLERRQYESLDELIQNELAELDLMTSFPFPMENWNPSVHAGAGVRWLFLTQPPESRLRLLPGRWRTGGKAPVGWERAGTDRKNAGTLCCPAR